MGRGQVLSREEGCIPPQVQLAQGLQKNLRLQGHLANQQLQDEPGLLLAPPRAGKRQRRKQRGSAQRKCSAVSQQSEFRAASPWASSYLPCPSGRRAARLGQACSNKERPCSSWPIPASTGLCYNPRENQPPVVQLPTNHTGKKAC